MQSTMFDFFKNYIVIVCDNYFRIVVNPPNKQRWVHPKTNLTCPNPCSHNPTT